MAAIPHNEEGRFDWSMSYLRKSERPSWTTNGSLVRKNTKKHYLAKHPFYYTSKELYDEHLEIENERPKSRDVKQYVDKHVIDDARRAFSAPDKAIRKKEESRRSSRQESRRSSFEGNAKKATPDQIASLALVRPKKKPSGLEQEISYQKTFPDAVNWSVTPIPGYRVIQRKDHYRRKAMDLKNTDIFYINSGLIPKYMGYVPGFKFRYGGTYGTLTYNAKEVGVGRSLTWGGAVSLF